MDYFFRDCRRRASRVADRDDDGSWVVHDGGGLDFSGRLGGCRDFREAQVSLARIGGGHGWRSAHAPAPSAHAASDREPFAFPAVPAESPPPAEQEAVVETELTPRQLGLVLSGTIVGDGRSTAVINGKVYGAGRELKAAGGVVFVVRQIEPWGIVLERAGRRFELALPRPTP